MRLKKLEASLYVIPTILVWWDKYYEGGLMFVELEIKWLKWAVIFDIWADEGGR